MEEEKKRPGYVLHRYTRTYVRHVAKEAFYKVFDRETGGLLQC